MAKAKETFMKREKQKRKLQRLQEKLEKMAQRKSESHKGKPLKDMIAFVDEEGNLTSTPADPKLKIDVDKIV